MALIHQFNRNILSTTSLISNSTSSSSDVNETYSFAIQGSWTDSTPGAKTFASATDVNIGTDVITQSAHGFTTGLVGQFTTSNTLPTGISAVTNYFIIVVDSNSYKVATSLANALSGTQLDITGTGTGNQTFTPTALSGGVVIQISNDGSIWTQIGSSNTISGSSGNFLVNVVDAGYAQVKCIYNSVSGNGSLNLTINGKQ